MDPVTLSLIGFALQEVVKNEPAIAAEFGRLLQKGDATKAEWDAALSLAQKPWNSFAAPISVLPPGMPAGQ